MRDEHVPHVRERQSERRGRSHEVGTEVEQQVVVDDRRGAVANARAPSARARSQLAQAQKGSG